MRVRARTKTTTDWSRVARGEQGRHCPAEFPCAQYADASGLCDLNLHEMAHERRADEARDGRQRSKHLARVPVVAFNRRVDRGHASHCSSPRSADGKDLNEITQLQHSKDGLESVSVDAHRGRDMRGELFLRSFVCSPSRVSACARTHGSVGVALLRARLIPRPRRTARCNAFHWQTRTSIDRHSRMSLGPSLILATSGTARTITAQASGNSTSHAGISYPPIRPQHE